MYLLEKASNSFAEKIASELDYDQDKKEVIAYGTYALLQIVLSIVLVIAFGWIFGVWAEALTVSVAGAALRRYTGGAHASSPSICVVVGTVVCVGFGLVSKLPVFINVWVVGALVLGVHLLAYGLIYRFAPVASPNKPIPEKRRPEMKRGGLVLNTLYLAICAVLIVIAQVTKAPTWQRFSVCIALGALWQVFSITPYGGKWLGAVDKFLSFKRQAQ